MWYDQSRETLGSRLRITFQASPHEGGVLMERLWKTIAHFEQLYSRFIPGNALAQINSKIGYWQRIDASLYQLLKHAENIRKRGLRYSLGVKNALESLGYGNDAHVSFMPHRRAYRLRSPNRLFLTVPIELGGFGKGYALDMVSALIPRRISDVCLDFGGDLYARGLSESWKPWLIALESPFSHDEAIGQITLHGAFLACSSPSRRHWWEHHHLIDPTTGQSAHFHAGSFVIAKSGFIADSLATALMVTPCSEIRDHRLMDVGYALIAPDGSYKAHRFDASFFA